MKTFKLFVNFAATKDLPLADYELKKTIRAAVRETLLYEGFSRDAAVSVTVCDNEHIRVLNKEYRNIDRETDVLSFPMYEAGEWENEENFGPVMLGDIVISLEMAQSQAEQIGHSVQHEAAFLCVHSVLHLLGYDHELGEDEEKEMFSRQKEIIEKISEELKEFDD